MQSLREIAFSDGPKPHVLSIGGCQQAVLFGAINEYISHKMLWRTSIPSLMSPIVDVSQIDLGLEAANSVMRRECNRKALSVICNNRHDIIVFDTITDFVTKHILIDNSVVVDFTNGNFHPDAVNIDLFEIPTFKDAKLIEADDPIFREMFQEGFDRLYRNVLRYKLDKGTKIVFICLRLCDKSLLKGDFLPWTNSIIESRRAIQLEMESFLGSYRGIDLLRVDDDLHFTSSLSPWGGPWEQHPGHEYYTMAGIEFMKIAGLSQETQNRFLVKRLIEGARRNSTLAIDFENRV